MTVDLNEYRAFIAAKAGLQYNHGFAPKAMPIAMKHHQSVAVDYALNKGRAALFLETGLGKSLIEDAKFDVYDWQKIASPVWMDIQQGNVLNRMKGAGDERHVCPLQLDTIKRCLKLYTKPGDVVMDPFNGIGSTGYEAIKMRRKYLGFELKPEYAEQANRNMKEAEQSSVDMFEMAA